MNDMRTKDAPLSLVLVHDWLTGMRGQLLLQLGRSEEARPLFDSLIADATPKVDATPTPAPAPTRWPNGPASATARPSSGSA